MLNLLFIVPLNNYFVMLKKRFLPCGFGGFNPSSVPLLSEDSEGKRVIIHLTPQSYFEKCPIDHTEFSLSEELAAGVPLQQLSPSNLIQSAPEMSEEQILENLESQQTQE